MHDVGTHFRRLLLLCFLKKAALVINHFRRNGGLNKKVANTQADTEIDTHSRSHTLRTREVVSVLLPQVLL